MARRGAIPLLRRVRRWGPCGDDLPASWVLGSFTGIARGLTEVLCVFEVWLEYYCLMF